MFPADVENSAVEEHGGEISSEYYTAAGPAWMVAATRSSFGISAISVHEALLQAIGKGEGPEKD